MKTIHFLSLMVGVVLTVVAILIANAATGTSIASTSPEILRMQRNWIADAARWTAMGEYNQKLAEAENITQSRKADAARWVAMGHYYQQLGGDASPNMLRSRAADAARWTAMAKYYAQLPQRSDE
jgi:cytochrome c-type biogenesis protein CcmH/NrfG